MGEIHRAGFERKEQSFHALSEHISLWLFTNLEALQTLTFLLFIYFFYLMIIIFSIIADLWCSVSLFFLFWLELQNILTCISIDPLDPWIIGHAIALFNFDLL